MQFVGVGASSLILLFLLLVWLRLNRCLGLIGSALAGALLMSSVMDVLWAWANGDRILYVLAPLALVILATVLVRWKDLLISSRWVAFGLVVTFIVRSLVMGTVHMDWTGKLSDNLRGWLIMAGLDPSTLPQPEAPPPRLLSDVEMPCGLDRFQVRSEAIKPVAGIFQLRLEPCGLMPQVFRVHASEGIEITNSLSMAVQVTFAPQTDEGEFLPGSSVVVPPASTIEVDDEKVPVGGAVLIYAPLEPQLGVVLGVHDTTVPGNFWISRRPLQLKRQSSDAP